VDAAAFVVKVFMARGSSLEGSAARSLALERDLATRGRVAFAAAAWRLKVKLAGITWGRQETKRNEHA